MFGVFKNKTPDQGRALEDFINGMGAFLLESEDTGVLSKESFKEMRDVISIFMGRLNSYGEENIWQISKDIINEATNFVNENESQISSGKYNGSESRIRLNDLVDSFEQKRRESSRQVV